MEGLARDIHKGMRVFDSSQIEIGSVDEVKFSDEDPKVPGSEAATIGPADRNGDSSLMGIIARTLGANQMPEVERQRLLSEGYVSVNMSGLFHADRLVLSSQIERISQEQLFLNVKKVELIKRP
jgi:hypothetical protein